MKHFLLLLLVISSVSNIVLGQDAVLKGFVYDDKTQEPVPFTNVYIKELETGAVTDLDGFYQIPKIPAGTYTVKVTNVQYDSLVETITLEKDQMLNKIFNIKEGAILDVIEINSDKTENLTETKVSVIKLDKKDIYRVPNIGGEADIISALTITPGVVSSGDQGGQIYVRGGTPIQNKILLDGMTIYNPFHSIGFFSVFETELIKSAEVYTGGFGAKYGGRISSIMDITYKDGNTKKVSGLVSVSPFMGRATLEVPLIKQKPDKERGTTGSFIFSAKQSLIEWTSKAIYPYVNKETDDQGLPFRFTDLYGKFSFKTATGSKFSIFGFYFGDRVNYQAIENLNWKSFGGGLNFVLAPPKSKQLIKGHLNFSNYATTMKENLAQPDSSTIFGFDAGFDFTYYMAGASQLDYGIVISGFKTDFKTYNKLGYAITAENFSMEIAGYATYKLVKSIVVFEPGVRVQYYASYNKFFAEPRLSMKINAHENFRLKMAGGFYTQNFTSAVSDRNVTQLFYGFLSAPTNIQDNFTQKNGKEKDLDGQVGLQSAWHAVAGFEADIAKGLSINLEGYYKWFNQLTNLNTNKIYPDNSSNSQIDDLLKKDFIVESGEAWGIDFLLKYNTKRINVWAAYSLAKVTRWDGFKDICLLERLMQFDVLYIAGKKWIGSLRFDGILDRECHLLKQQVYIKELILVEE
ncbi:MAG: TonB-dependent receptor [Crocinitomicaceae bacterium]